MLQVLQGPPVEALDLDNVLWQILELRPADQDVVIRRLAKETGVRVCVLRAEMARLEARRRQEMAEAQARAREEAYVAEIRAARAETGRIWLAWRQEEPRLPAEPLDTMLVMPPGYLLTEITTAMGRLLQPVGPAAVPYAEVPGTIIFLARDPWGRWHEITVPVAQMGSARLLGHFKRQGIVPIPGRDNLWSQEVTNIWFYNRDKILTPWPEPPADVAHAAARALWEYFVAHPDRFRGAQAEDLREVEGAVVNWDRRVIAFRPHTFRIAVASAGVDVQAAKYALAAKNWIERDSLGNFSVNLAISRGGVRGVRFVVVTLAEVATEPVKEQEVTRTLQ
ncbi:MAG: hypothetical protein ACPLRW_10970 [Moorellales bacterium]